jgi:hypothetical protein
MQRPNLDYASPNAPRKKTPWLVILAVVAAAALLAFVVYKLVGM